MNSLIETVDFQRVIKLSQIGDRTALNRQVGDRLATAQGRERAFWLIVRAYERAMGAQLTHVLDAAWSDLEEALRIAPDDLTNRAAALAAALNLCLLTERADLFLPTVKGLRHCYHLVDPVAVFWQFLGTLHVKRRQWHQAARALGRCVTEFNRLEPLRRDMYQFRLAHCYAWHAISLVGCGRPADAAASIAMGLTLAERQPPEGVDHVLFATAQAELALHEGRLQEARAALQRGLVLESVSNRPKQVPSQLAETELLAARIARAEGNEIGFAHFCNKALAICSDYKLPLTEARVRAVMAGATM